ncbi:MAG TPA: protein kinase [Gemmatimonadales bacterium]|nr:protein kinase [Gemmatimonadales bacterium]
MPPPLRGPVAGASMFDQLQSHLSDSYRLERELGGGGMSRVFLATDTSLERPVVIKVLTPLATGEVSAARFRREILVSSKLQHPLIVPLLAAGQAGDLLYYTMPYVEGESLRERVDREGALPLADVIAILRDLLSALVYAHGRGIVHRDIKPENIMLSGGQAVILDFGVARALDAGSSEASIARTTAGMVVGTPMYMAPEQAAADPAVDHRADLYALGLVAYELLAGAPPFGGKTPQAIMAAHVAQVPEPVQARRPEAPDWLAALVAQLLAKEPSERPQSAKDTLEALERDAGSGAHTPVRGAGLRRTGWVVAALVVALVVWTVWSAGQRTLFPAAPDDAELVTLGVMPFENLSGDPDDAPLVDGLSEELIDVLGRVPGLRVAARTSSFALKGQALPVDSIGRLLGVSAIVSGTMRRSAEQLRVTVRLEDVASRETLWSEQYNRPAGEHFAIQEGIARQVVTRLVGTLAAGFSERLVARRTQNLEAHDLVLRGRYALNSRLSAADSAPALAVGHFARALELDPDYAAAAAGLSEAYTALGALGMRTKAEVYPLALDAAERAVAIDPADPDALKAHGFILAQRGDLRTAENVLLRARAVSPYDGWIHHYHALVLVGLGRFDEAVAATEIARLVDPLGTRGLTIRAVLGYMPGREVDLREDLIRTVRENPRYPWALQALGVGELMAGRHAEAVAHLEQARATGQAIPPVHAMLVLAYRGMERGDDAQAVLDELRGLPPERQVPNRLVLHAASGELDEAFALANQTEWDFTLLIDIRTSPFLQSFRADPRYPGFLSRFGLEP